jgi:hypothetical protein
LAKLIPSAIGFCISMIFIPGVLFYILAISLGTTVLLIPFLLSLVPLMMWLIFLSWLTMCLATFFDKEGPVMAVPFPFLFIGPNLGLHPIYGPLGPWGLVMDSISVTTGESYAISPVIITLGILLMLAIIAVVRFQKHEF